MKTLHVFWRLAAIVFLLAVAYRLSAQDNKKIGGVWPRVDDQHPTKFWTPYYEVFKKNGCHFTFAVNLGDTGVVPLDVDLLKTFVADSNEIADHTQLHSTAYVTDSSYQNYSGRGVHHFTPGSNRVCLSYERIDTVNSLGEVWLDIRNAEHSYLAYPVGRKFPKSVLLGGLMFGVYSPELDLFFRLTPYAMDDDSISAFTLWNAWLEPVTGKDMSNVRFKIIHCFDFHLTDDAVEILLKETINLCKQYGLRAPVIWIQPGAPNPYIPPDQLKRVAEKLGFIGGGTYPNTSLKCFNEYNPSGDRKFAWETDFSPDTQSVATCERIIADAVARHCIVGWLSHLFGTSQNSQTGAYQENLNRANSVLGWCRLKNIPVRTLGEWLKVVYDTPQDPDLNVFPSLIVDLNGDGIPDGFVPADGVLDRNDGVSSSGGVSYSVKQSGVICRVEGLGGLEKGANTFSVSTKGSGTIPVTFTLHSSAGDLIRNYVFPATTPWQEHDTVIFIPNDVSLCDVEIRASGVGSVPAKVSGMFLAKASRASVQTIVASAGSGGKIVPSGLVQLIRGETQIFSIKPDSECKIESVIVDSVSVGAVTNYTFSNVSANHTIAASFRLIRRPIVATAAAAKVTPTSAQFNGFVNPNGFATTYSFEFGATKSYGLAIPTQTLPPGSVSIPVSWNMTYLYPDTVYHYRLTATNADGTTVGNDTIFVTLPTAFEIKANAISGGGRIVPSGNVTVAWDSSQTFRIVPDSGFRVVDIMVDGKHAGQDTVYVFRNVTGGHWITAMFGSTMVTTVESNGIPTAYGLSQNYPNPFNPTTTIRFAIPKRSYVTLKVFNVLGAEIATLISQEIGPGRFSARWNADVPSGAYFYRLQASDFVETKKMLLLR